MTDLNPVDAMTTDFRAMCAELLVLAEESISYRAQVSEAVNLIDRARAALAEPEPEEPTDQALDACADEFLDWNPEGVRAFARAVLARWGSNTSENN